MSCSGTCALSGSSRLPGLNRSLLCDRRANDHVQGRPASRAGWYANASPLYLGPPALGSLDYQPDTEVGADGVAQHAMHKYAAVHNIQRLTPQNQEWFNCTGQSELFLLEADIDPDKLKANRDVTVRELPSSR